MSPVLFQLVSHPWLFHILYHNISYGLRRRVAAPATPPSRGSEPRTYPVLPLSVSYIHQVCLCFLVCIIPPAPTPSARAEAAGLRLQAIALGLRRTISYCSGPSIHHVFLQSDIALYIKRFARGASRFALGALAPRASRLPRRAAWARPSRDGGDH